MDPDRLYTRLHATDQVPFFVVAGPCVIESREATLRTAHALKAIGVRKDVPFVFKSSFDKANRTCGTSFRGPGLEKGLRILREVREEVGIPVLTDVHETWQVPLAAEVVDVLQIPAFLCRQTDLLVAAGRTGKIVNIKKGQFLSPETFVHAVEKVRSGGSDRILVCERGTMFGYGDLVLDPRSLVKLRQTGCPVVHDCTHSVQQPGGLGHATGGLRQFVPTLARTAVAVGVDGLFFEVHEKPQDALSDSANQWPLDEFEPLLEELIGIARASRGRHATYQAELNDKIKVPLCP